MSSFSFLSDNVSLGTTVLLTPSRMGGPTLGLVGAYILQKSSAVAGVMIPTLSWYDGYNSRSITYPSVTITTGAYVAIRENLVYDVSAGLNLSLVGVGVLGSPQFIVTWHLFESYP